MPKHIDLQHALLCRCTVCNRPFKYGDEVSPMLDDQAWKWLIKHYGLEEHERRANAIQARSNPPCSSRIGHTYICARCAEKAFGRPLRLTDLNGSAFNIEFIKSYFGYSEKQASYFIH
ncbi:hypothetical protein [uncultured Duncaniella sp.]|uniref:hypothetical protein n=2 Tax=uncultured Duncaniella sp. TaxID=2768039 RepID=UPI00262CFBAF|nr:hypothetical protein [uncultured Duncaniella sp.]